MEAEARPGARQLCMVCLQRHWYLQQHWMQTVSHTFLEAMPCLALLTLLWTNEVQVIDESSFGWCRG